MDKAKLILNKLKTATLTLSELNDEYTRGCPIKRRGFLVVEKLAKEFIRGELKKEWVIMSGLRGIGKTTILSQLYVSVFKYCGGDAVVIYVSLDNVKTIGANMSEFASACEQYVGIPIEQFNGSVVILLDEVQYLENWTLGLKDIYDRAKNIFIFCTGSSALNLQIANADIARRTDLIRLHPLCFTEYVLIKQTRLNGGSGEFSWPIPGLGKLVKDALFYSMDAKEVYDNLAKLRPRVDRYWNTLKWGSRGTIMGEYISYGTLPFALDAPNKTAIFDRINRILCESLDRDVSQLGSFDRETSSLMQELLFVLASSVEISMRNISSVLGKDERTIGAMLAVLEKTEIVSAIPPKGSHIRRTGKPNKYIFTSPSMRVALCNFGGAIEPDDSVTLIGKTLEDIVGMYLKRLFLEVSTARSIVQYDTRQGGADYIVNPTGLAPDGIALEVGRNKKTSRQAIQTTQDISGKYGLIVTYGELEVDESNKIVKVPLDFFLLM